MSRRGVFVIALIVPLTLTAVTGFAAVGSSGEGVIARSSISVREIDACNPQNVTIMHEMVQKAPSATVPPGAIWSALEQAKPLGGWQEYSDGWGGGTCWWAEIVARAVNQSDLLTVIEWHPHSRSIPACDGLTTAIWEGTGEWILDYRFRNDTGRTIVVELSMVGGEAVGTVRYVEPVKQVSYPGNVNKPQTSIPDGLVSVCGQVGYLSCAGEALGEHRSGCWCSSLCAPEGEQVLVHEGSPCIPCGIEDRRAVVEEISAPTGFVSCSGEALGEHWSGCWCSSLCAPEGEQVLVHEGSPCIPCGSDNNYLHAAVPETRSETQEQVAISTTQNDIGQTSASVPAQVPPQDNNNEANETSRSSASVPTQHSEGDKENTSGVSAPAAVSSHEPLPSQEESAAVSQNPVNDLEQPDVPVPSEDVQEAEVSEERQGMEKLEQPETPRDRGHPDPLSSGRSLLDLANNNKEISDSAEEELGPGEEYVKYSYYWPPLLGTNCYHSIGGECRSAVSGCQKSYDWPGKDRICRHTVQDGRLRDGQPLWTSDWNALVREKVFACPPEWGHGSRIFLRDGTFLGTCADTGEKIVYGDDGLTFIDDLRPAPTREFGSEFIVRVEKEKEK